MSSGLKSWVRYPACYNCVLDRNTFLIAGLRMVLGMQPVTVSDVRVMGGLLVATRRAFAHLAQKRL
jgi:hypothetical protein